MNSNLYFVNHGQLKMVYRLNEKEFLLKTVGPGTILGMETFFSITVCTTSLISLTRAKIHRLQRDTLQQWHSTHPALEPKLKDYCHRLKKVHDLIRQKGLDRRSHKRINLNGKGVVQLLDGRGEPMGKAFKSELADVSIGGLSFFIKTSKPETARLLLGRKMQVNFILPDPAAPQKILCNGTVVGVGYQMFSDYSVHLTFDGLLDGAAEAWIDRR
jgi:CRP-like cAMP-binding protein